MTLDEGSNSQDMSVTDEENQQSSNHNETELKPHSRNEGTSDEGSNSPDMSITNEENTQSSNHNATKLKRKRGPTRMEMPPLGEASRMRVHFNERGQVISRNSAKLSSYLGVIARKHVPVVIKDWGHVDSQKKDELWTFVLERFIIDGCHKSMILQMIGRRWRQYKAKITKEINEADKKQDETNSFSCFRPSNVNYVISNEEWDKFVKERLSPAFQAKSEKYRAIRKKQKFVHTMSRKGYARLEHEMKKDNANPSAISRVDVWTRGHLKRNGEPLNKEVGKIVEELQSCTQSNTNLPGSNIKEDAIAKILGPERSGHVRGLGLGATPSRVDAQIQCGGRVRELEDQIQSQSSLMEAQSQRIDNLERNVGKMFDSLLKHFQQNNRENVEDKTSFHARTSQSQQDSDAMQDNGEGENARCQLLHWYMFDTKEVEVVAEGRIESTDFKAKVQHMPLGRDCWKVKVEKIISPNVSLYRPTDERVILKDNLGASIAWPISSIKLL